MKKILALIALSFTGCSTAASLVTTNDSLWVNMRSGIGKEDRLFYCTPKGDAGKPLCVAPQTIEPEPKPEATKR